MGKRPASWVVATLAALCAACGTAPTRAIPAVAQVDLPRFMGDWYVIAHIPSFPERKAFDAVESYALRPDGKVQTTFRYRHGGFDQPLRTMRPVGTVRPGTRNAVWGMQFLWPIQAEYVIVYVDADYQQTIVGRSARDYAWIMARKPRIAESDYRAHLARLKALGYDIRQVRRVPHAVAQ